MIVNKRSIFLASTFFDFILINISFITALFLSHPSNLSFFNSQSLMLLLSTNFVWLFYTSSSGLYNEFVIRPFPIQFYNILKLITFISIVNALLLFIIIQPLYTRFFIFIQAFLLLTTVTARTIIFKFALRSLRNRGKSIRNLLIIGANEIGRRFKEVITRNPEYGHRFVGFINQNYAEDSIGTVSELDRIIKEKKVEDVVIAHYNNSSDILDEIVNTCNKNAVKIHVIPDYFKFLSGRFQMSTVSDLPVITIRDEPLNEVIRRFIKRVFDIFFSLLVLIFILSWFVPIMSLIIRLESNGRAFFIQERIGVRRKPFRCYKFRTLCVIENETKSNDLNLVVKSDPRVTRIGKFLRKTNLDELPQFINILKGEMSVVGPRPHPLRFEQEYEKVFEGIMMRYNVRPGLTGWAQINGLRGDVIDKEENKLRILERMKYDLWYIENWSMKLDLQIILLTIWQMIKGETKGF